MIMDCCFESSLSAINNRGDHRKKLQIPISGYFRVFKEYPQKSRLRVVPKIPNLAKWGKSQPGNSQPSSLVGTCRAVIKSWGPGIFPGYYECGPRLLLLENRRKLEPKETPRCLIPRLLFVFTRQLEILATTLDLSHSSKFGIFVGIL